MYKGFESVLDIDNMSEFIEAFIERAGQVRDEGGFQALFHSFRSRYGFGSGICWTISQNNDAYQCWAAVDADDCKLASLDRSLINKRNEIFELRNNKFLTIEKYWWRQEFIDLNMTDPTFKLCHQRSTPLMWDVQASQPQADNINRTFDVPVKHNSQGFLLLPAHAQGRMSAIRMRCVDLSLEQNVEIVNALPVMHYLAGFIVEAWVRIKTSHPISSILGVSENTVLSQMKVIHR